MARKPLESNFSIVAPAIGPAALRPDLEDYAVPVVVGKSEFPTSFAALLALRETLFDRGMDAAEAAQVAQLRSRQRLAGIPLQQLANQADEAKLQYDSEHPEIVINITHSLEEGDK